MQHAMPSCTTVHHMLPSHSPDTSSLQHKPQKFNCLQVKAVEDLERHRLHLLHYFEDLHLRIGDAKSLAAAACKSVGRRDKVSALGLAHPLPPPPPPQPPHLPLLWCWAACAFEADCIRCAGTLHLTCYISMCMCACVVDHSPSPASTWFNLTFYCVSKLCLCHQESASRTYCHTPLAMTSCALQPAGCPPRNCCC